MTISWFRDREAWTFIARRYLPWLGYLNAPFEADAQAHELPDSTGT